MKWNNHLLFLSGFWQISSCLKCSGDAKREAEKLWCFTLGCFVKRVVHLLGGTVLPTVSLNLDTSAELRRFPCWLQSYIPSSYFASIPLFLSPNFFNFLHSFCVLHISFGLVPLIEHSCHAHRKSPFFSTLLYKLAGFLFLRLWRWVTSIKVVHTSYTEMILLSPLTALTPVIQPTHKCLCVSVCLHAYLLECAPLSRTCLIKINHKLLLQTFSFPQFLTTDLIIIFHALAGQLNQILIYGSLGG